MFQEHLELRQLELNIQLFYIKLTSYYQLISSKNKDAVNKHRNAFAHELTPLIFNKKIRYNFLLHKVTKNFKKFNLSFTKKMKLRLRKMVLFYRNLLILI